MLEGYARTEDLKHDRAFLSLTFLDGERRKICVHFSQAAGRDRTWQKLRLGPLTPDPAARQVVVGVHVEPGAEAEDLRGSAAFGDLWLGRLPRITLSAARRKGTVPFSSDDNRDSPHENRDSPRETGDTPRESSSRPDLSAFNLFTQAEDLEITCSVSGLDAPTAELLLELSSAAGQKAAESDQPLVFRHASTPEGDSPVFVGPRSGQLPRDEGDSPVFVGRKSGQSPSGASTDPKAASKGPAGSKAAPEDRLAIVTWRPAPPKLGFYRLTAKVLAGGAGPRTTPAARASLTLAIIEPGRPAANSQFGWNLPGGEHPLGLAPLAELAPQAGIGWVKFPFWCAHGGKLPPMESLIAFQDRLSAQSVAMAAVVCPPPRKIAAEGLPKPGSPLPLGDGQGVRAAASEILARDPKSWYPPLEPVLARLGNQIRWWQFGADRDAGWTGYADLSARVAAAKAALDWIGHDLHVGISWPWDAPAPRPTATASPARPAAVIPVAAAGGKPGPAPLASPAPNPAPSATPTQAPWKFLALAADWSMTADDLGRRLDALAVSRMPCWVAIQALPADGHAAPARAENLVKRMVAAKIHGAEAIWCPDPFDPQCGLVHADGTPGELFLPWRTTALQLGGARYAGSLEMPGGSQSRFFARPDGWVAVVWNDRPAEEKVYLGDAVRQIDLWGASEACGTGAAFHVDRLPRFLTGLSEPLAEWQLAAAFARDRIPTVAGQPQANCLALKNCFPRAVVGRATLAAPANWQIEPRAIDFQLAPGQVWQRPLEITLPGQAVTGRNPIRIDFEVRAERVYRFAVYRHIQVGLGDLRVETAARLNPTGDLVVQQTLVNSGGRPVSFRFELLIPDRRRQTADVVALPPGRDQKLYRLPRGRELLGKTLWLRGEEIDGPRVLNYPLVVRDDAAQAAHDNNFPAVAVGL